MLIIFGTIYLMDISPLLVKFQPHRLNTCKMTGKLKLYVKNCQARLKQMRLSPALTDMRRRYADVFTQEMITSCSRMVRPLILVE
jgi:hypothetical protein